MAEGKEVPNVNFILEFCLPNYPNNAAMQDRRKFYSSNKYNGHMKYIETGIKDLKNIDFVAYLNIITARSLMLVLCISTLLFV